MIPMDDNLFGPVVGAFTYYLNRLLILLEKIETEGGSKLLSARLNADMLPLNNHARACANFSLRGCCPLAAEPVVSFETDEVSFDALYTQIRQTITKLHGLDLSTLSMNFQARDGLPLKDTAGFAELSLEPGEFIYQYIFPNFYFHLNMVYATARCQGVTLSKQDYDGYHQYPAGFSFER